MWGMRVFMRVNQRLDDPLLLLLDLSRRLPPLSLLLRELELELLLLLLLG